MYCQSFSFTMFSTILQLSPISLRFNITLYWLFSCHWADTHTISFHGHWYWPLIARCYYFHLLLLAIDTVLPLCCYNIAATLWYIIIITPCCHITQLLPLLLFRHYKMLSQPQRLPRCISITSLMLFAYYCFSWCHWYVIYIDTTPLFFHCLRHMGFLLSLIFHWYHWCWLLLRFFLLPFRHCWLAISAIFFLYFRHIGHYAISFLLSHWSLLIFIAISHVASHATLLITIARRHTTSLARCHWLLPAGWFFAIIDCSLPLRHYRYRLMPLHSHSQWYAFALPLLPLHYQPAITLSLILPLPSFLLITLSSFHYFHIDIAFHILLSLILATHNTDDITRLISLIATYCHCWDGFDRPLVIVFSCHMAIITQVTPLITGWYQFSIFINTYWWLFSLMATADYAIIDAVAMIASQLPHKMIDIYDYATIDATQPATIIAAVARFSHTHAITHSW